MTDRYWDGNQEEVYEDRPSSYNTFIRVNGSDVQLAPGTNFVSAVKEAARNAGLGKFRVYLNGDEVQPQDAPDTINEGMALELRPYDKAGC